MKTMAIEDFVSQHFTVKSTSGNEWSVLCPSHGDHNASMRINVAKGAFFCHGCHIKGGMSKLARLVGATWTTDKTEMDLGMLVSKLAKLGQGEGHDVPRFLPESSLERYRLPTGYWTDPRPHGRGFTDETVEAFDLGYDPLNDCAIIPVRNVSGRLLGVTRRFLDPDAEQRYKDPKGFKKANNLFGSWLAAADDSPTLVLTEGPLDAIKVWQAGHPAVAQFGSYITPRQIKLLRELGTLKVVLFYDNDNGGRLATRYAQGFSTDEHGRTEYDPTHDLRKFFVLSRVQYRVSAKDPGDMSDVDIDRSICAAKLLR